MHKPNKQLLIKLVLPAIGILAILAFEIRLTFGERELEKLGAFVATTTLLEAGDEVDGHVVRFEKPVNASQMASVEKRIRKYKRLRLSFEELPIDDKCLAILAGAENIRELELSSTGITDASAAVIASMPHLNELNLSECNISDKTLDVLQTLPKLKVLRIVSTSVTDEGLQHFAKYRALQKVVVGWGLVTPDGVSRAQQAATHVELQRVGPPFEDRYADIRITEANGSPLEGDGGEIIDVCRRYFAAWQEKDVYTLKSLFVSEADPHFGNAGKEYREIRPLKIESFSGFANENAATVVVAGPSTEFSWVKYRVQLSLREDEWKIKNSQMLIE